MCVCVCVCLSFAHLHYFYHSLCFLGRTSFSFSKLSIQYNTGGGCKHLTGVIFVCVSLLVPESACVFVCVCLQVFVSFIVISNQGTSKTHIICVKPVNLIP